MLAYEVGACGIADGATFKATFKFCSDWALFQTADPSAANEVSSEYEAGPSPATVQSLGVRFDQKGHERPFQPENAGFGFRPVYFSRRQRDGSRVWSSAQFITFAGAGGEAG